MMTIQKPKRMWQKKKDYNKKKLIRKIQRRNKVSFDDGKDRSYQDWKTKAAKYKHIDIDHDNTFDYEGFYNSDPDNAYRLLNNDPTAHFDDTYKTVYHPTFSDLSIYSGKVDSRFNPEGLKGGHWVNDHKYISPKQSPVSMDERIAYLGEAEDNGVQLRTYNDQPIWLDDGTRWDGVLPNVVIKPKRYKNGKLIGRNSYGDNNYLLTTNVQKPFDLNNPDFEYAGLFNWERTNAPKGIFDGYDSVYYGIPGNKTVGASPAELVVPKPTNYKSLLGNNGNFNVNDENIYRILLPLVGLGGIAANKNHNSGKDIHIKKANRGKFTEAANEHNMGVQEFARQVLSAPKGKYSSTLRKRANFARNFAH